MQALYFKSFLFLLFSAITSCAFLWWHDYYALNNHVHNKLVIVCTTTIIADAVRFIGGDRVQVECLMGPGIDPHTYRAREGDVHRMINADLIFYNGLHLEGRMQDIMNSISCAIETVAVTEGLDRSWLRFLRDNIYDPHVWHDVYLWRQCVHCIAQHMIASDTKNADYYNKKARIYDEQLEQLDQYCMQKIAQLPEARRIVVTAHDAFYYCAQRYHFCVMGLQGMSTEAEVTMRDIEQTVALIVRYKIPTIFVESSVSPRAINAVREGVAAYGFAVEIGQELYSDSLSDVSLDGSTYQDMMRHNIDAIVVGLLS